MKWILTTSVAIVLIGLSSPTPSSAHMRGKGMGMMGGSCPMMNMMATGGMMDQGATDGGQSAHMAALADGRLAYLKSELAITETQTDAWNEYAKVVKAQATTMQEMHAGMMKSVQNGTTVQRMEARIKGMQAMTEALIALKPATAKLYDVLTPEQKEMADELIGVGCGGM